MAQADQPVNALAQQVIDLAKSIRHEITRPDDASSGRLQPEDFEIGFAKAAEALLNH